MNWTREFDEGGHLLGYVAEDREAFSKVRVVRDLYRDHACDTNKVTWSLHWRGVRLYREELGLYDPAECLPLVEERIASLLEMLLRVSAAQGAFCFDEVTP